MSAQETIDLRALPSDELERELDESLRALFNLRFQAATRQLADVSQVRRARRRVARVRTLLRERNTLAMIAEAGDADALEADETMDEAADDDAAAEETMDDAADDDAAAGETMDEAAADDAAADETTDEAADDDAADGERE